MYYSYDFTGDYHCKEDGTHEVKLIVASKDNPDIGVAYCEGEIVPKYGEEIKADEMPCLDRV